MIHLRARARARSERSSRRDKSRCIDLYLQNNRCEQCARLFGSLAAASWPTEDAQMLGGRSIGRWLAAPVASIIHTQRVAAGASGAESAAGENANDGCQQTAAAID